MTTLPPPTTWELILPMIIPSIVVIIILALMVWKFSAAAKEREWKWAAIIILIPLLGAIAYWIKEVMD